MRPLVRPTIRIPNPNNPGWATPPEPGSFNVKPRTNPNLVPYTPSSRGGRFPTGNPNRLPPANSDGAIQTWNIKRPPGNPNGRPDRGFDKTITVPTQPASSTSSKGGIPWRDILPRVAKEAFWETVRPQPVPDLGPVAGPEYRKWAKEENRKRGYYPPTVPIPEQRFPNPIPEKEPIKNAKEFLDEQLSKIPDSPNDAGQWRDDFNKPFYWPPEGNFWLIGQKEEQFSLSIHSRMGTRPGYREGDLPTSFRYFVPEGYRLFTKNVFPSEYVYNGDYPIYSIGGIVEIWIEDPQGNQSPLPRITRNEPKYKLFTWGYLYRESFEFGNRETETSTSVTYQRYNIVPTDVIPAPDTRPLITVSIQQKTGEDEMQCQNCQARQMLRELSQTISVESVSITKIPTGDLIATTTNVPKRVFALPGTQDSIKDQFNIFAEIKRRTVAAVNQARRAKVLTRIMQLMNITDVFLNVHNAMMLSADIGETFFDAIFGTIDIAVKLVDDIPVVNSFFDADEFSGFDSKELITKQLEEVAKKIFGVQKWEEIKAKTAAFNTMIRSANTVLMNMKDLRDTQGDLAQMAAERIAVVNNGLVRAGVLDENGDLMSEKVNRRSAFLDKLEKIEDSGVINTAVFFQGMASSILEVKETKKELEESRAEFQKTTQEAISKLTGDAATIKQNSQGASPTRDDTRPPE